MYDNVFRQMEIDEYADAYITSDDTMTYVVDTEKIHFKDENGK